MEGSISSWEQAIARSIGRDADVRLRPTRTAGKPALILFLSPLVDKARLDLHIMRPLQTAARLECPQDLLATVEVSDAALFTPTLGAVEQAVLAGEVVCLVEGVGALRANLRSPTSRAPTEPSAEDVTRGPRDSFAESLQTNLGLVRMRMRDRRLRVETFLVGRRSQTPCALLYVDDVADPAVVKVVSDRLNAIDIDGVISDSIIEQYLTDHVWSPFPLLRPIERPDWVVWEVLQGKVAILVDGSATAILAPATFLDFYRTSEDYKHNFWETLFVRNFLRPVAFLLGLYMPAIYIALTDVNPGLLPTALALSIAGSREGVPFPSLVEVLFMELGLELLREAALRMPRVLTSSVGIVGGLVLGQAAVEAKLISDIMVVVISVTALAQFVTPSQELTVIFRVLRYGFSLAAAFLGMYGLVLISFVMLFHIASLRSVGVVYLSPLTVPGRSKSTEGLLRPMLTKFTRRRLENQPQDPRRAADWDQPWHKPDLEAIRSQLAGGDKGEA